MAIRNLTLAQNASVLQAPKRRMLRRPSHPFQLKYKPFTLQPFFIAPVLPGETMQNLMVQARVVTDPIRNKLCGWWSGLYFYYVKLSDLDDRDDILPIFTDLSLTLASLNAAANAKTYHYATSPDFVALCLDRVVDEYWRYEGEAVDIVTIDGMPAAPLNVQNFLNSAAAVDVYTAGDIDVDLNQDSVIGAGEVQEAMMQYNLLQQIGLTRQMSYEDYLASYNVRVPEETVHRPELIRFVQDWSYPTNTIEPTTGAPSSAVVWSHAERADKNRFFKEPGFLFGVACVRPKVYFEDLAGTATSLMTDAYAWLPAFATNDPRVSLRQIAQGGGPVPGFADADGYVVDIRDLLLYGEQFVNFDLTVGDDNALNLPTTTLGKRYPVEADVDDLFVDTVPGGDQYVQADGIVNVSISTMQADQTPTT